MIPKNGLERVLGTLNHTDICCPLRGLLQLKGLWVERAASSTNFPGRYNAMELQTVWDFLLKGVTLKKNSCHNRITAFSMQK